MGCWNDCRVHHACGNEPFLFLHPPSQQAGGWIGEGKIGYCLNHLLLGYSPASRQQTSGHSHRWLGGALFAQTVASLHKFSKLLGKSRSRCPVNDVMVEAQRQIQILAHFYLSLNHPRLLCDTAKRNCEWKVSHRYPPSAPLPEHSYHRHHHRTRVLSCQAWVPHNYPIEESSDRPREQQKRPHKPGFCATGWFRLRGSDLLGDLPKRFPVCGFNDVRHGDFSITQFHLDHRIDVHVIEYDKLVPPIPLSVHLFVHIHSPSQTSDHKGCERE